MSIFKKAELMTENLRTIRAALSVAKIRLEKEKKNPDFGRVPLYFVLKINEEISILEMLLKEL